MSTFSGIMAEFRDIRVDCFRHYPGVPNPLAGFLSHVHSDHLTGLETLKAPFIYCSAATRNILLRLERYPQRINFALKITETRKQTYRHLKRLLKPIPLETPTRIELSPGNEIQITLFDANHCTGAVMFLFENDRHAVLYTGDIRSEPWFVNQLSRNPSLIEYTSGIKTLDCIYLDTTFTEDLNFPTKAQGIAELLDKVSKYPESTVFHISAWTFGYEDVWLALSKSLNSPLHVDDYKIRIYKSLCESPKDSTSMPTLLTREAASLAGYTVGNTQYPGILTRDQTVRLHSCEKGTGCEMMKNKNIVWITPIITRLTSGVEIGEAGVGGGGGDLTSGLELDEESISWAMQQLTSTSSKQDWPSDYGLRQALMASLRTNSSLFCTDLDEDAASLTIKQIKDAIAEFASQKRGSTKPIHDSQDAALSRSITFPYSRHSSYEELCNFVKTFRPHDIYPCTVDQSTWHEGVSIKTLFGQHCSRSIYRHDSEMLQLLSSSKNATAGVRQQTRSESPIQSSEREPQETSSSDSESVQQLRRLLFTQSSELLNPNYSREASPAPILSLFQPHSDLKKVTQTAEQPEMFPPGSSSKGDHGVKDLLVTGISSTISEDGLARLFECYGEVEKCLQMLDHHTKLSRGFAFVRMMTAKQANDAMENLTGENVENGTLTVEKTRSPCSRTQTPDDQGGTSAIPNRGLGTQSFVHRNSQGKLRYFDHAGKEIQMVPCHPSESLKRPATELSDSSDDLGREVHLEDAVNEPHVPLHKLSSLISSYRTVSEDCQGPDQKRRKLDEENAGSGDSDASNNDSDQNTPAADTEDDNPEESLDAEEHPKTWYWDEEDEVNRCNMCKWEFYEPRRTCFNKFCSTHEAPIPDSPVGHPSYELEDDPAYLPEELYEKIVDEEKVAEEDENGTENEYLLDEFCVDDLDELVFSSEPEDSTSDLPEDETDDEKTAWEQKYRETNAELQRERNTLADLAEAFDDYRRTIEGSDYESFYSGEDGGDSDGLALFYGRDEDGDGIPYDVINVNTQDPPVTEVILPSNMGDSQGSSLGSERVADRIAGFKAALDDNGWEVSMLSTGDNHTSLSQEL